MSGTADQVLDTSGGTFPLFDYRLRQAGREWSVLHTGTVLTEADETRAIVKKTNRLPYGVALWPSAIALAHDVATRAEDFRGRSVLELGAGTGLPGIVAASLGARLVQTDRDELTLQLCKQNGERNGVRSVEYRLADWTDWGVDGRYEWIIGSDILYGEALHPHLRQIFASNLEHRGRVLLSDPLRDMSIRLLETLEAEGWGVTMTRWNVGEEATPRFIGVFELTPPGSGDGAPRVTPDRRVSSPPAGPRNSSYPIHCRDRESRVVECAPGIGPEPQSILAIRPGREQP